MMTCTSVSSWCALMAGLHLSGSKVSANNATIKSDNLNIAAVQDSKALDIDASLQLLTQYISLCYY